jgi:hypothetical protein
MSTSRKGGGPPASHGSNFPFSGDGLSRLLAAAESAPAPKLHVGPGKDGKPSLRVELPVETLTRFVLQRDEDRPLQFDGTVLMNVESAGGPILHRAAVYRTKGGKFVSEFSSRPNRTGTTYNDPPRRPTVAELDEYRELIIGCVIETAEWREGKAEQFPRDLRNSASAEALRRLATKLDSTGVHDARWTVLWLAERNLSDHLNDDERMAIAARQAEQKSEQIRGYGFYADPPIVHPDLEAQSFLDELIKTLEEVAQPNDVAPPSGKAAVFDSLESALAWFRPGRLTTELLKKLGKWGPEIIE